MYKLHGFFSVAAPSGVLTGIRTEGGAHPLESYGPAAISLALATGLACALVYGIAVTRNTPPESTDGPGARTGLGAPHITVHGPRFETPARSTASAEGGPRSLIRLDQEIAELGSQSPVYDEALRERYLKSGDLYRFFQELLPAAQAGERVSQFYLYLTLGQCQTFLRLDAESAQILNDSVLLSLNDRPAEERLLWQSEYQRCQGFAGGDLNPLRAAMGEDTPGSENEYASIWFQRAAAAGYAPALAEAALRINLLSLSERRSLLEEAVQSGDAEVYWQLFLNNPGEGAEPVTTRGLAWLLIACRGGHDCTRTAEWFRGAVCMQDGADCAPGESALEHYWYALPAHQREQAYTLASRIEQDLAQGQVKNLPWPSLSSRNIVENRFGDG